MVTKALAGVCTLAVAALSSGWVLGTHQDPDPWDGSTGPGVGTALSATDLRGGEDAASRGATRESLPTQTPAAGDPVAVDGLPAGEQAVTDPAADDAPEPQPAQQDAAEASEPAAADTAPAEAAAAAAAAAAAQRPSAPARPAQRPAAPAPTDRAGAYAAELVAGVNAERTAAGLGALTPHACAQAAAQEWAEHLVATATFEHQDMGAVMNRCKVRGVGENIAMSPGTPQQMVEMWMGSTGHRQNILRQGYTGIGSAVVQNARGSWVGVHVFVVG